MNPARNRYLKECIADLGKLSEVESQGTLHRYVVFSFILQIDQCLHNITAKSTIVHSLKNNLSVTIKDVFKHLHDNFNSFIINFSLVFTLNYFDNIRQNIFDSHFKG